MVIEGITWRMIGNGRRVHAFLGEDRRFAYCSLGPGDAHEAPPDCARCGTCTKRLARIARQRAQRDALG